MITCHNNVDDENNNSIDLEQYKEMLSYGLDKEEPQKPATNYAALFIWAAIITFFIIFSLLTFGNFAFL